MDPLEDREAVDLRHEEVENDEIRDRMGSTVLEWRRARQIGDPFSPVPRDAYVETR